MSGAFLASLGAIWGADLTSGQILLGPAIIATIVDGLVQAFLDLFDGGSDAPPPPYQLKHGRHPVYVQVLGISPDLIPDEASSYGGPEGGPGIDGSKSCKNCGCTSCELVPMTVTGYCNDKPCTNKTTLDPGYGITAYGFKAGQGSIAADRRYHGKGAKMYIPGYGCGVVVDTGNKVMGSQHIDIWFPSKAIADVWGHPTLDVQVCK